MITLVTGVSHEKLQVLIKRLPRLNFSTMLTQSRLQVFHRWISYAMYILALIHTFPFIVNDIWSHDMINQWDTSVVYWTGVVALLAQTWLTFGSMSPIR